MKNKVQKIGSYIIIFILFLGMTFSIISFLLKKIVKKYNINNNTTINNLIVSNDNIIEIKWEKLFPFDENIIDSKNKKTLTSKYISLMNSISEKTSNLTSDNLINYEKIVEYSYYYDKIINFSLVSNSSETARVKINNNYLTRIVPKVDITESAERLIKFNKTLESKNINFIFVQAPYKIPEGTNLNNDIYKDYSNLNMNNLKSKVINEIDYLDLREYIKEEKLDHLSLFYKTDHHWLPQTGLWATSIISKYINQNYSLNLNTDILNLNQYEIIKYDNMFLGADGKYVTLKNTKPETFELIVPSFDTQLDVNIPEYEINKIGSYQETLINNSKIKYGNYYLNDQYSAYSYGTTGLIEVHNKKSNNGKKILLIRDSFSNVVIPFMALETEYLSAIDLRSFSGSLINYIDNYNPDIVIMIYTGNHYANYKESTNDLWIFE